VSTPTPTRVREIDWAFWQPTDRATLTFVVRDGQILLIRKKRGLGGGKVNGPGGKLEPGETTLECAIRETREELEVAPIGLSRMGRLRFQFIDGYSIHVTVYRADDCDGEPRETDEAIPLWCALDAIPYREMWMDDVIWLPHLIDGQRFDGCFVFDDDRLLDHRFDLIPSTRPLTGHVTAL